MNLFHLLYTLSPEEWLQKIYNKIRTQNNSPTIRNTLSSSKHMRSQRLYDFLSRYETIIAKNHSWVPIDFKGRNVIEIGTGPAMGWAPLAVFLGCAHFTCIEPFYNPGILDSPIFIRQYLLGVHKDLTALYGQRMTFEIFLKYLKERVRIVRKKFLEADTDGPFEVVLSNSCLEHIHPLDATIQRLKSLSAQNCRFIHVVDFGNHLQPEHPFNDIYIVKPEEYFAKHGKNINLHRASDVLEILRNAGFDTSLTPWYYYKNFYYQKPITYWTNQYSEEDLFLKCGIFSDTTSIKTPKTGEEK